MLDQGNPTRAWHTAHWPALAWLETGLKLPAFGIGLGALLAAGDRPWAIPTGLVLAQGLVLLALSLGLLAAVYDRWLDRERIALGFVALNNLGHWGLLLALLRPPLAPGLLATFAGLMLAGDLAKLAFLRRHRFRVRDVPPRVVYGLTLAYALGYGILLGLGWAA